MNFNVAFGPQSLSASPDKSSTKETEYWNESYIIATKETAVIESSSESIIIVSIQFFEKNGKKSAKCKKQ